MQQASRHVVGVDSGTLPGRAVAVRVTDGDELGTGVHEHPHAVIEDVTADVVHDDRSIEIVLPPVSWTAVEINGERR